MSYKTLNDLMEGKQPGEIRVRRGDWPPESWFRPFFVVRSQGWMGLMASLGYSIWDDDEPYWTLWTEPAPPKKMRKVKMYRAIYKVDSGYISSYRGWHSDKSLFDQDGVVHWDEREIEVPE